MRDAAGELDDFHAALDVALGVRDRLAVLGRKHRRQRVVLLGDQLQELEHHAGAALRVGGGPCRLRLRGIGDCLLDLGLRGQRDLRAHFAGVGVEHVRGAARSLDLLAADEMADLAHGFAPGFFVKVRTFSPSNVAWLTVGSQIRNANSQKLG
jgi:hypothetical protein